MFHSRLSHVCRRGRTAAAGCGKRTGKLPTLGANTKIIRGTQAEAFYWHEEGTFHAIVSYTNLDDFVWSRARATRLVHKSEQGCCSTYLGWDLAGMGNNQFYAIQTGPVVQVPINVFYFTVK